MVDFRTLASSPEGWLVLTGIVVLILCTNACHEGGHALLAWWSGDRRPSIRRRVTLNPLVHLHWFLSLVLPVLCIWLFGFVIGGARPVLVDAGRIGPRRMALVALAGPLGNFLFCGFLILLLASAMEFAWIDPANPIASPLWKVAKPALWFSAALGILNLLPLPPLDGSRVVGALLPDRARAFWYRLAPLGLVAVLLLMLWVGGFLQGLGLGGGFPRLFTGLDAKLESYITAVWE
jgi:Zn-dependent protease